MQSLNLVTPKENAIGTAVILYFYSSKCLKIGETCGTVGPSVSPFYSRLEAMFLPGARKSRNTPIDVIQNESFKRF